MNTVGRWLMALALGCAIFLTSLPRLSAQSDQICFAETDHCIAGRFREYWQQNGGLAVFGLPLGSALPEAVEGRAYLVQWFERARFELHPENPRPDDVLLGRLGDDLLRARSIDWTTFVRSAARPGCRFFAATSHTICGAILARWRSQGIERDGLPGFSEAESLALFGLPLSEERIEVIEGREYTVQWFERTRFELHPEYAAPNDVLLGRLGAELVAIEPAPPPSTVAPEATPITPQATPNPPTPSATRTPKPRSEPNAEPTVTPVPPEITPVPPTTTRIPPENTVVPPQPTIEPPLPAPTLTATGISPEDTVVPPVATPTEISGRPNPPVPTP